MRFLSLTRSSVSLLAALAIGVPAAAGAQGIERPRIPLRTALNELSAFRAEYTTAANKHDNAALGTMFAPDAIMITSRGEQLAGRAAIMKMLSADTTSDLSISSDTTRVVGHTAWDVGTVTTAQGTSRYLAVLRRGLKEWQLASLAVVPQTGNAMGST
jgi:ketosteroid isomerase-like protein